MVNPIRYFDETDGRYIGPEDLSRAFPAIEEQNDLPTGTLMALLYAESPAKIKTSSKGARGPFQIKDNVRTDLHATKSQIQNPLAAAELAARFLGQQQKDLGGYLPALAAWNWGRQNLRNQSWFSPDTPFDVAKLPPPVLDFIKKNLDARQGFKGSHGLGLTVGKTDRWGSVSRGFSSGNEDDQKYAQGGLTQMMKEPRS